LGADVKGRTVTLERLALKGLPKLLTRDGFSVFPYRQTERSLRPCSHPLAPEMTESMAMIKISINKCTRFLSTRGSSISLKINDILDVNALAFAILKAFVFFAGGLSEELKPDAMRLTLM
jgi:hypothetical protein